MVKKYLAGLVFFGISSLASGDISLTANTWELTSNKLQTDINTTTLNDKNITALWQYTDGEWYFYSSDSELQNNSNYTKIEAIKTDESFWIVSKTDNNISIETDIEQLYFIPEITGVSMKDLNLTKNNNNLILHYIDDNNISNTRTLEQSTHIGTIYGYDNNSTKEQVILNLDNLGFIKLDILYNNNASLYYLSSKDKICTDKKYQLYLNSINYYNAKKISCN